MFICQNVAPVTVNTFVKFDENNLNFVKVRQIYYHYYY